MGTDNQNRVGFRFHPTDEEIVSYFLQHKVAGRHHLTRDIAEIDLCQCDPWELPGRSAIESDDHIWYFFCKQDRKYKRGRRANRTTKEGYWKATGKDRKVRARGSKLEIGTKKTLVFYKGRVPKGARTGWVMHEYRLPSTANPPNSVPYVVCCVKNKEEQKLVVLSFSNGEIAGDTVSASKNIAAESTILEPGTSMTCEEVTDDHAEINSVSSTVIHEVHQQEKPKSVDEYDELHFTSALDEFMKDQGLPNDDFPPCDGLFYDENWMLEDGISFEDLIESSDA